MTRQIAHSKCLNSPVLHTPPLWYQAQRGNIHSYSRQFTVIKWYENAHTHVCMHWYSRLVQNELISGHANVAHTSSLFRPHTHTHTHTCTFAYHLRTVHTYSIKPVLNWANVCSPEHTSDTSTNYDSFLN